jgi:adenylyl-sulfate kinase
MMPPPAPGHVFWLFGLSGAGKSTMADSLIRQLRAGGRAVLGLDGDALRTGLCRELGFSDADRAENLRRAAEVARMGADSGLCVVAAFITPLNLHRRLIREIVGPGRVSLVFADAPLTVCQQRDVKGLYARARAGQVAHMTGLGSAFEAPDDADLTLPTSGLSPESSARTLLDFAVARLGPAPA